MFKTNLSRFLTLALSVLILFSSCDKEKEEEMPKNLKTVKNQYVKDYGKWYYFSFATGSFVGEGIALRDTISPISDSAWAERTDWDIAFHRNNVRTNSGLSGKGQGGVMVLSEQDINNVKEVPQGTFYVDEKIDEFMAESTMPPVYTSSSVCKKLNSWIDFNHDNMAWEINADKRGVFIIKTADGKYASIQLVNFLNDKDESGYLTFKYNYQPDGSKKFE